MRGRIPTSQSEVASSAILGENVLIGVLSEESVRDHLNGKLDLSTVRPVQIHANCILMNFVTIHEGVMLCHNVLVEDYCRIGAGSEIGSETRVIYGAYICDDVRIGSRCRIAGFVCDDVVVEDDCTVMGRFVHAYTAPHKEWWDVTEKAAKVRHHSIVGMSATVVGNVEIGPYSYVAAGAVVTKTVPPWHVAIGRNKCRHIQTFPGLSDLIEHWQSVDRGQK